MSVMAVSLSICFALLSWLVNPFACCPRDSMQPMGSCGQCMESCQSSDQCMEAGGPLTAATVTESATPNRMGGADSQLGKSGAAGSLDATSFTIPKVMADPDPENLRAVMFDEAGPIESAFVSPIKHPPRL